MFARPAALLALTLPLALATACGHDGNNESNGFSASATEGGSATDGTASESDASASATEGSASATVTASASASASASATDSDGSASATATTSAGTTAATDSTGMSDSDASTTGVTATDSDSTTTDSTTTNSTTNSTTDDPCTPGTLGCPCDGDACDGELLCDNGLCVAPGDPVCGNGVVEMGEACDDGNDDELDGCTSACEEGPVCPAGTENCPCDVGDTCDADLVCQAGTCKPKPNPVCGNKVVEGNEECDDGNQQNWDACSNACTKTSFAMDPCGFPEDGVWLDINYKNAGSVYSPKWSYSSTPGYGETEWTANGKNWPEINLKGAVSLNNSDPIAPVADVSSGQWLRIMIGLGDLISYESATVCITGRSISVGSSVTVEISNPAFGCAADTMLSNVWQLNTGGVDLGNDCLVAGNDFQAVQFAPIGGSGHLGLRSARVTLHKPVF
ncbi:MAG: hypothetical protein R3B09_25140 [Nannocystaceae bacterium]